MQPALSANRSFGRLRDIKKPVVVIGLVLTALFFIPFMPVMPSPGLDPSWRLLLNIAVESGYVFGRDLIFTFGPLGSVYSTLYSPYTDSMVMAYSVLYAAGFIFAVHFSAPSGRQWWAVVLPFLVCLLVLRDAFFLVMPFFLLLAVTRVTLSSTSMFHLKPSPLVIGGLAIATMAMGMGPIVKGSFSGTTFPIAGLIFFTILTSSGLAACAFALLFVLSICFFWALSGQAIAALPEFFIAQGPLVSGYSSAMSLEGDVRAVIYFLLGICFVGFLFAHSLKSALGRKWVLACLAMALTMFVSFKAGFVRQDEHVFIALGVMLFMAYGASLYARNVILTIGIWCVAAVVWYFVGSTVSDINVNYVATKISKNWHRTFQGMEVRLARPEKLGEEYRSALKKIREDHPLASVNGTVDLYPTELSAVFANELTWSGRPVPQSYSVYEPVLDAKNVAHLRSARAPETVFFSFATIDSRLPSLDDSGSVLELLAGYSVYGVEPPYVLLKRHDGERGAKLQTSNQVEAVRGFGDLIELNADRPVWMQIDMKPSVLGKFQEFVFRMSPVLIEVHLENGFSFKKRLIPKVAEAGFIVSPFLEKTPDFVNLAAGLDYGSKVKSVRIDTVSRRSWEPTFSVKQVPIDIKPQRVARLLMLSAPEEAPALQEPIESAGPAQCYVDSVNGGRHQPGKAVNDMNGVVKLEGWVAPIRPDDGAGMQVWAVVEPEDGTAVTYFKASRVHRPDVAAALKRPLLQDAGFSLAFELPSNFGSKSISLITVVGGKAYKCADTNIVVADKQK